MKECGEFLGRSIVPVQAVSRADPQASETVFEESVYVTVAQAVDESTDLLDDIFLQFTDPFCNTFISAASVTYADDVARLGVVIKC